MSTESIKNNELNLDQIDKVDGGLVSNHKNGTAPSNAGNYIDKYEAESYIGKTVYISDGTWTKYAWGTLVNSYEKDNQCAGSTRTQRVRVSGVHDFNIAGYQVTSDCYDFSSKYYSVYEYL